MYKNYYSVKEIIPLEQMGEAGPPLEPNSRYATEFTVDRSTVYRWANRFRGSCVSTDMTKDQEGREHQQMKEV